MKKIGVIFGGKSKEHEISILSASAIIGALKDAGYETVPIGINKNGDWYLVDENMEDIASLDDERFVSLIPESGDAGLINAGTLSGIVDFAFPALHGPNGEDGTIQGLFEMLNIPYAGCGVACSSISMDKIFTKELLIRAGLPVCKHTATYAHSFVISREDELTRIESELSYPMFVKPANMGSSVGVGCAENRTELADAVDEALRHDSRVLIEEKITGRELEAAVCGSSNPKASAIGEIITNSEFYDYDTKYKGSGATLDIPAKIPEAVRSEIENLACKVFSTLGGDGFSRVDFFLEDGTGKVYVNEMNTIPGFTKYSMFPLLWDAKGLGFAELVDRIVGLGYERHNAKNSR